MKRRGLLLDRDGVINVDHGYVSTQDQFEFMPGLFPFLREVQDMGFRLAIITNQSGVAQGRYTAKDFIDLTQWMHNEFSKEGIVIDLVLACFEHAEGKIEKYRRESFWRKPNPGMVIEAVQQLNLDPERSAFLGDQARDLEAAQGAGIRHRYLLESHYGHTAPEGTVAVKSYGETLKLLRSIA